MRFDFYVGVDYSGAKTADDPLPGLQVYVAAAGEEPRPCQPSGSRAKYFSRRQVAEQLRSWAVAGHTFFAGIDHGFGFPVSYLDRYGLATWHEFLLDFVQHWPTDQPGVSIDSVRAAQPKRLGQSDEFRLTERWTSSAKSVFQFDMQGSVAKSTHAGLPWVHWLRQALDGKLHVWPFDGWGIPAGRCVVAEVYPSLVRHRFPRGTRSVDAQDAYAVAAWLASNAVHNRMDFYLQPPLTEAERQRAEREGWIYGVT